MDTNDELAPEDFEAAWATGTPADVTPSRPRMIIEGQGSGLSTAHFEVSTISVIDASVTPDGISGIGSRTVTVDA